MSFPKQKMSFQNYMLRTKTHSCMEKPSKWCCVAESINEGPRSQVTWVIKHRCPSQHHISSPHTQTHFNQEQPHTELGLRPWVPQPLIPTGFLRLWGQSFKGDPGAPVSPGLTSLIFRRIGKCLLTLKQGQGGLLR